MNVLDLFIGIVLIAGAMNGWRKGFVKSACSLIGFFAGLVLAYLFYMAVGDAVAPRVGGDVHLMYIIAFVAIWVVVPIAASIVGSSLTRFLSILPLFGSLNSLAGAALGFVEFFLGSTCVVFGLEYAKIVSSSYLNHSFFAGFMHELYRMLVG